MAAARERPTEWKAAYRDMLGDRRVVWAAFADAAGLVTIWIRDRDGDRKVCTTRI